jgi:hypothetical protein
VDVNLRQIVAVIVEAFISTTMSVHQRKLLDFPRLLYTTMPVSVLYFFAILAFLSIPGILDTCYWYDPAVTMKSPVEKRLCMMVFQTAYMNVIAWYAPEIVLATDNPV